MFFIFRPEAMESSVEQRRNRSKVARSRPNSSSTEPEVETKISSPSREEKIWINKVFRCNSDDDDNDDNDNDDNDDDETNDNDDDDNNYEG